MFTGDKTLHLYDTGSSISNSLFLKVFSSLLILHCVQQCWGVWTKALRISISGWNWKQVQISFSKATCYSYSDNRNEDDYEKRNSSATLNPSGAKFPQCIVFPRRCKFLYIQTLFQSVSLPKHLSKCRPPVTTSSLGFSRKRRYEIPS